MNNLEIFKTHQSLPITNEKRLGEGGIRISQLKNQKKPLISLITVVKDGDKFLEETIKSVLNQSYKNFEYIIIDGGSKDGSLDIIKKYSSRIDYWVSETDNGIYDAFNKGMRLALGDYIGIINSDDVFLPNALEILEKYILQYSSYDFFFGSVKKHWGILHGYKPYKIYYSWGFYSSHSTGFFIKTSSAKKVGLYNIKYKYHADYDYFFRMIVKKKLKGMATKKNEIFGIFRRGGYSSTIKFYDRFLEEIKIRYDNGQNVILIAIIFLHKFIKNLKTIILSK